MKSLGDHVIGKEPFPNLKGVLAELKSASFQKLTEQEKFDRVGRVLLKFIQEAPASQFVLIPVIDFIEKIDREKILDHFHFNNFELWLNQSAGLSPEENYQIRGKIAGRFVPRAEYQRLFPIGMGKMYPGSHFVTAHTSPDLDTTVSSFWGWVDAFAARVSEGIHVWNIPGGLPPAQMEVTFLFYNVFGPDLFRNLAKHRASLSISSLDLVTQKGMAKRALKDSVFDIDYEKGPQDVVLVDPDGYYVGEWRNTDFDRVRSLINLLNQCLRWYENSLHVKLISIFAIEKLTQKELKAFFDAILSMKIEECEPAKEFTPVQRELVEDYLRKVLGVAEGLKSTFAGFAKAMVKHDIGQFEEFARMIDGEALFDAEGRLIDNRSKLFGYLAKVIGALENAIYSVRLFVDRLDVALQVKSKVLGLMPHHVNFKADIEEIRTKIDGFPYLTVTASDKEGQLFPLGIIHASDIFRQALGTVTLRDFSNREETKVPPYLEVISIIDHHKSQLSTTAPSVTWITDSQSSNALVAQISFEINDRYSTGGMAIEEIEMQIAEVQKDLTAAKSKRILQRLLQKQLNSHLSASYFVSPERETLEYLQCLYAILDDTDLLTKVSPRDIDCVASLLNRLKSLTLKKEVEVIDFDDIPRDADFVKNGAKRILQNDEMYSLYRKIYLAKEETIDQQIKSAEIFADTKIQNGCCRIGQTKLFEKNFPTFAKAADKLRKEWLAAAQALFEHKKEVDFHLQMISTLPGAEELYKGEEITFSHQDEIWIWVAPVESGIEHLKIFLSNFRSAPCVTNNTIELELLGENAPELKQIFEESFGKISIKTTQQKLPIAIFKFNAGSINSRKAQISPYLPKL